jgi:prepilin-type N-terminal cleavage/methylation domain-containing protein
VRIAVNRKKSGLTLVELLITIAIIAMLVGLLLPALSAVRKAAKEVKQQAQITTIELAISAFKNDYGDYPPSDQFSHNTGINDYCGAQKLSEALLGWDLLGFHPKSTWSANGCDTAGNPVYSPTDPNLRQRKGPYLELATANAFQLGEAEGLFANPTPLNVYTYVICDVFGRKSMSVGGKPVKAGTPILYYRANTSSKTIIRSEAPSPDQRIYNVLDNYKLIGLGRPIDLKPHPLNELDPVPLLWEPEYARFYKYIRDTKLLAPPAMKQWPYRPDSYILISAGADGFYGTPDDIRNFGY